MVDWLACVHGSSIFFPVCLVLTSLDCEQSLRMVARARKARVRKSSEASESRGEVSLSANSLSPVLPSLDLTEEGLLAVYDKL